MIHTKFKIFSRHLAYVVVVVIVLRRYLFKQLHRGLQYDVNNLGTKLLSA